MISIITCSVSPERLQALKENIAQTIGAETEYEVVAINNAMACRSIAAVYNHGASIAKYPYLLFIHEDAGFISHHWGREIVAKLSEPDCGVIGFAGSKIMYNFPSGWGQDPQHAVLNLVECGERIQTRPRPKPDFSEVITTDGFAMFCRRDVWQEFPFDEEALTGFHCYDIDFTLTISEKYKNYVCNTIIPFHDSRGNFDRSWLDATVKLYKEKWEKMLPRYTPELNMSASRYNYLEERACFRYIKWLKSKQLPTRCVMRKFLSYPPTPRHSEHLLKILFII